MLSNVLINLLAAVRVAEIGKLGRTPAIRPKPLNLPNRYSG
jgi:hypothetical protein